MSEYRITRLKKPLNISGIYTVHYFEYAADYKFRGEKHDFWELVYVDQGEVIVTAEKEEFVLQRGYAVLHRPNEWHNIRTVDGSSANVAIITFGSNSAAINSFENSVFYISQREKTLISEIISSFKRAFTTELNNPNTKYLERRVPPDPMAEQQLMLCLTELLMSLCSAESNPQNATLMRVRRSQELVGLITDYMQRNITEEITIEKLEAFSGTGRTTINELFRESGLKSPIAYFIDMKLELAKRYLREGDMNVTQIAEALGYSTVHYFSRLFKKHTGMSPLEYSSSVKALGE